MKKLKNFIEKKKADIRFKNAGQGHSLTGSGPDKSGRSSSAKKTYQPPQDTADRRQISAIASEAAERRLRPEVSVSAAQRRIREEARKALEEEQRLQEIEQGIGGLKVVDPRDGVREFEHSAQISTLLFTCDLFDNDVVLPKAEMIKAVEEYLRGLMNEEPVEASIIMIWSLNAQEKVDQAIPILLKYLTNITNSPGEAKFRQIKMTNKTFSEKIAAIKGGVEFIKAVGFFEDDRQNEDGTVDTFLALPEPDKTSLEVLQSAAMSLENGARISLKLYRDPKVYRIDPNNPVPNPKIPQDFFALSASDIKKEQQQRSDEVDKLTTLRTSKMREADARLRHYKYRYTLIRIRFPNQFVLQGVFSVHESFENVREFVAEKLVAMLGPFTLTDPVNNTRFDDEERSFDDYGLLPAAVLYFDWDSDTLAGLTQRHQSPVYLRPELEQHAEMI